MNKFTGPLPPSPQIWLPSADSFGLDPPNSSQHWYCGDEQHFSRLGKHRRTYIRNGTRNEFPTGTLISPLQFILVIKLSDWHLRVPIWRGQQFFPTNLTSDAAVLLTVAECIKREWCDRDAIRSWYKAGNVGPWQA